MTERKVKVCCNVDFLIEKHVDIETKDFEMTYNGKDEEGYDDVDFNFDGVDFVDEYASQHLSIVDLLSELKQYVEYDLSMTGLNTEKGKYLQRLLKECEGWKVVEHNVEIE